MKHVKTFENFAKEYDNQQLDENVISDLVTKTGDKISTSLIGWDKPENIEFAKKFALQYIKAGKIKQEDYDKAKAVNFDPKHPDSKNFLKASALIKSSLKSHGSHTFGGGK